MAKRFFQDSDLETFLSSLRDSVPPSYVLSQDLRPFGKLRAGSGLTYAAPSGLGIEILSKIVPRLRSEKMTFRIDHLGIAVKSLAAAKAIYEKLGLSVSPEETVVHEQVRVVMVPVGESRLELLEATSPDSAIGKFITKRGEGLHHVCLKVPDLPAAVARLKKDGVRLVSEEIKTGAGGHRYVFVHPSSAGGVLLELVEG